MAEKEARSHSQEYEERFGWRKARQIDNLKELSELADSGGANSLRAFPGLRGSACSDDPLDALRWSILLLWCEATECFIFGEFQSSILVCGAVVERSLKLTYEVTKGALPAKARWTLGKCIHECEGIVSQDVLDAARSMLEPRNSRAHALLEHSNPQLAISGGEERGIEILSSRHYLVEPYRGEAKDVIVATYNILQRLFGPNLPRESDPHV
jgi:hypothetical protein